MIVHAKVCDAVIFCMMGEELLAHWSAGIPIGDSEESVHSGGGGLSYSAPFTSAMERSATASSIHELHYDPSMFELYEKHASKDDSASVVPNGFSGMQVMPLDETPRRRIVNRLQDWMRLLRNRWKRLLDWL